LGPWHVLAKETDIAPTSLNQVVTDSTGATHNRINPALVDDLVFVIQFQAT
jgi:hypothetical protein